MDPLYHALKPDDRNPVRNALNKASSHAAKQFKAALVPIAEKPRSLGAAALYPK